MDMLPWVQTVTTEDLSIREESNNIRTCSISK